MRRLCSLTTFLSLKIDLAPPATPMPSAMSPPFTAVATPFPPLSSDLNDDSTDESEILLCLCKNTLKSADFVPVAMRSCISECVSALNASLSGDSISEQVSPLSCDSISICDEYGFNGSDLDKIVPDSVLPDSVDDESAMDLCGLLESESMVPETQFELQGLGADSTSLHDLPGRRKRKRKDAGSVAGAATLEPASVKAEEWERVTEDMMRILLHAYFLLVRSFPVLFLLLVNLVANAEMELCGFRVK